MTLAAGVVTEVERCLGDFESGASVVSVTLQVGRLRAVVPDALAFCFEVVSQGTPVEGARLIIEQIPVRVRCGSCETEWTVTEVEFMCPVCEGPVEVLQGKELLLRAIEIDDGTE